MEILTNVLAATGIVFLTCLAVMTAGYFILSVNYTPRYILTAADEMTDEQLLALYYEQAEYEYEMAMEYDSDLEYADVSCEEWA